MYFKMLYLLTLQQVPAATARITFFYIIYNTFGTFRTNASGSDIKSRWYVALRRLFNLTKSNQGACYFSHSQVALEPHRGPLGRLCQIDILAQWPRTYRGDRELLRRWSHCVFGSSGLQGVVTHVFAKLCFWDDSMVAKRNPSVWFILYINTVVVLEA